MAQKFGSLLAVGVTREFLDMLPILSSRAAQILLIPLSLSCDFTSKYNDLTFIVSKKEIAEYMQLPKSYKSEGHINKLISDILIEELFPLKVNGIDIIDMDATSLPRGYLEITYTQAAMDRFFQGLTKKQFFTIGLDTLTHMKNRFTWQWVKEMILSYDFSNSKVQLFKRHTRTIKEKLCGFDINKYTNGSDSKFERTHFDRTCVNPVIEDLKSMKQFKLHPVKGSTEDEIKYIGKDYAYRGKKVVNNYFIAYQILKVEDKREYDISDYLM